MVHAQLKKLLSKMERTVLNQSTVINKNGGGTSYFIIDKNTTSLTIPENLIADILFLEIPKKKEFKVDIKNNSIVNIAFLVKDNLDGYSFIFNIYENAKVECFLADFTKGKEKFSFNANLLGEGATMNWHLASLTAGEDNKIFDISVNHIASSTFAKMDNYGVCKDSGKLVFSGISTINNGSKGSKTHQNSKIMVFDELSKGIAKPILKIDENDIEASHAAVVGKISDEHLFYLTSRGLSESVAKELITFGYLKPIMNGFIEEEIKNEISSLIEGRM